MALENETVNISEPEAENLDTDAITSSKVDCGTANISHEDANSHSHPDKQIQSLISDGNYKGLLDLIKQTNKETLVWNAGDIIPPACALFTLENYRSNTKLVTTIKEILSVLLETCNSKELLLILVEQVNDPSNDFKFEELMPLIQRCLIRSASPKGHSIALALEMLYTHVASLPLPAEQNLEGKERMLLDLDETIIRINNAVRPFLQFMLPFADEVSWMNVEAQVVRATSRKQIKELTNYSLRVLNHPLAYVDLGQEFDSPKSNSRVCAELCLRLLGRLQPDFVRTILVLEKAMYTIDESVHGDAATSNDESCEDHISSDEIPELGLATFSYLVFGEYLPGECVPQVYTPWYLCELNCHLATVLMRRSESLLAYKGIILCERLLQSIEPRTVESGILESNELKRLVECVVRVVTNMKGKELTDRAVQLLALLLRVFVPAGRYRLLHFLLKISPRVGVIGFVITMLRDQIVDNLDRQEKCDASFLGTNLQRLLQLVFSLPSGERTDLLDNSERIMGALNLLRFLVLRDTLADNVTGIWDMIPLIEEKYFKVLRVGINMSRSHYKLEMAKVQETKTEHLGTISAEGRKLTRQQQLRALDVAVNTFDMMEAILCQLTELVGLHRKL